MEHLERLQRIVTEHRLKHNVFPTTIEIPKTLVFGLAMDLHCLQYRSGASITEIIKYIEEGKTTYMGIPCKVV